MKNVTTTTMQAINKAINKRAATDLHNVNGIDWNTPGLILLHFEGSYTINKIVKELTSIDNSIPCTAEFLILTRVHSSWNNDRYYITRANAAGKYDVEKDTATENYYSRGTLYKLQIDYRFGKSYFNDDRKIEESDTFVIYQPGGYKYPKTTRIDLTIRHNVKSFDYINTNTGRYINRVYFADGTQYNNIYYDIQIKDIRDFIDNSGYIVIRNRRDLKRRARALREEREKAAAAAKDYSVLLADLKTKAAAAKAYMVAALTITDIPKEIESIGDKLWRYNGLAGIYRNLGRLEGDINNKLLKSPAEAEERAADILAAIEKITGQA